MINTILMLSSVAFIALIGAAMIVLEPDLEWNRRVGKLILFYTWNYKVKQIVICKIKQYE